MTSENAMYGPGWVKCDECHVEQSPAGLVKNPKADAVHIKVGNFCVDVEKCARWKLEFKARR